MSDLAPNILPEVGDVWTYFGPTEGAGFSTPALEIFDVTSPKYGAVGNGITDDTASINRAIAAAQANGRGIVLFPSRRYRISGALTPITTDNVVLVGENAATILPVGNLTGNLISLQGTGAGSAITLAAPIEQAAKTFEVVSVGALVEEGYVIFNRSAPNNGALTSTLYKFIAKIYDITGTTVTIYGAFPVNFMPSTATTGDTDGTTTILNIPSTSGVSVGTVVSGTNIAADTFVTAVLSDNSVTINQAATGTTVGGALTFADGNLSVKPWTPLQRSGIRNLIVDGSGLTGTAPGTRPIALIERDTAFCSYSNLLVRNMNYGQAFVGGGGVVADRGGFANNYSTITAENAAGFPGTGTVAAIHIVGQTSGNMSYLSAIPGTAAVGTSEFGVQIESSTYCNMSHFGGFGTRGGRNCKFQGVLCCSIFGLIGNGSITSNGIAFAIGSSYNHVFGATAFGNEILEGFWFSNQFNQFNFVFGLTARGNLVRDVNVGATDTGNALFGVDAAIINNAGNALIVGVNSAGTAVLGTALSAASLALSQSTASALTVGGTSPSIGGINQAIRLNSTQGTGNARFSANTSGPTYYFGKSRGSVTAPTAVQAGDILAEIIAAGDDGQTAGAIAVVAARLRALALAGIAAGIVPGRFTFDTRDAAGALAQRMQIALGLSVGTSTDPGATNALIAGTLQAASLLIGATDVILARDAANVLAQRNSTAAQILRVYGTYTDGSNYERGAINTGANYVELAAETAGTGDDDLDVRLTPAGAGTVRTTAPLRALTGTAIPAGGTAGAGILLTSTANFGIFVGSGAPTLSAAQGSLYLRSDGSGVNDRAYINTDGGTTWTPLVTVA